MSAATPNTPETILPSDYPQRTSELMKRTAGALKELALRHSIPVPDAKTKTDLVAEFAKSDEYMRAYGWPMLTPAAPVASTGNIDPNGDVIGATPTDPYDCDDDGFPADSTNVAKLEQDHLDALTWWLITNVDTGHPTDTMPEFATRDEQITFVTHFGYQPDEDDTPAKDPEPAPIEPDPEDNTKPAHIPTAAPEPRTLTSEQLTAEAADNQRTDAEHHAAEFGVEDDGQLTLVPGGDAPVKSILNIGSLRHDLGVRTEFKDGDRVRITFEVDIDKIAFIPEKSGGEGKRRVRTHAGVIDKTSVEVAVA